MADINEEFDDARSTNVPILGGEALSVDSMSSQIQQFLCDSMGNAVGVNWEKWMRRFDLYMEVKQLKTSRLKKATLLFLAGPQVQEIFYSLPDKCTVNYCEPKKDDYELAVEKLNEHFLKKKNLTYERHIFRGLFQKQNERFDHFVIRLRQQAVRCEFGSLIDDQIKDQIVEKCLSTKLKEKILEKGDELTLSDAVNMGISAESVSERIKVFNNTNGNSESFVNKIHPKIEQFKKPNNEKLMCSRCGRKEHASFATCPARLQTCNRCQKVGHFSVKCRSVLPNTHNSNELKRPVEFQNYNRGKKFRTDNVRTVLEEKDDESVGFIFAIQEDLNADNETNCIMGGIQMQVIIDSGSRYNLIDIDSWNYLKLSGVKVSSMVAGSNKTLKAYGGHLLSIRGTVELDIEINNVAVKEMFLVMNEKGSILIGSTTAKKIGILCINDGCGNNKVLAVKVEKVTKLNKIKDILITLPIDETVRPIQQPFRRVPVPLEEAVERKIQELIDRDIIEPVEGPAQWISPMVIVPKNNGDVRICIDMRRAITAILRENYPLPTFEDMLPHIGKGKIFSKLDIEQAFHQMEMDPQSRYITTFITKRGLFRFKRLIMGISCAPELFQKKMEMILAGCQGTLNYIDDIIIYGKSKDEHDSRLNLTLKTLNEANVALNMDKCEFGVNNLEFLGHRLTGEGIKPSESKLLAVQKFRAPNSSEEVRSFLGLVTYLGKCIPNMASITDPLRKLIRIGTKFVWLPEHELAFKELKLCLSKESILGYFVLSDKTQIISDASPVGLGAVLIQIGVNGPRVIAFASKSLTETEKRYCQTEKEALAIVWAIEKFHFYICGLEFDLITDHKPLEIIFGPRSRPSARIERWVLRLQQYRYKIIYKSGKTNIADVFSRLCQQSSDKERSFDEEAEHYVCQIVENSRPVAVKLLKIQEASEEDNEIKMIREAMETGHWSDSISAYKFCSNEYCFSGQILLRGQRIVVPQKLRESILQLAHEGHPGITVMKRRLRSKVWWPKMDSMVEDLVKKCYGCILVSNPSAPEPLIRKALPEHPWQQLAIDLLGPLPSGHYLLVTIDYFSRYKEIDILTKVDSTEIIKHLKIIFSRFGIPISITCDNGRQFISDEFKMFCEEYNIQRLLTTPYWPQMNGEVEVQNRSILKRIRISHKLGRNWRDDLNEYLLMYRATEHSVTGKSPAELMFGRKMRDKLPEINNPLEIVIDCFEETRDLDKIRKEKGKEAVDRKRRAMPNSLSVGDYVLLKDLHKRNKLSTNFEAKEFQIIERNGSEIVVKDVDGVQYRRNVSHAILAPKTRTVVEVEEVADNHSDSSEHNEEPASLLLQSEPRSKRTIRQPQKYIP